LSNREIESISVSFEIGACLGMAGLNGMHIDSYDDVEKERKIYLDFNCPA
jgi:hypothetical protein